LNSLRIFGVLVVAALVAGAAGASSGLAHAAGPTATANDLGALGGVFSFATAVNAGGDVIGDSLTAGDAGFHATLWHT
jgi:uncharacterized membrane protein